MGRIDFDMDPLAVARRVYLAARRAGHPEQRAWRIAHRAAMPHVDGDDYADAWWDQLTERERAWVETNAARVVASRG